MHKYSMLSFSGQKYRFRVSAENSVGEGVKSSSKDGSTVAGGDYFSIPLQKWHT